MFSKNKDRYVLRINIEINFCEVAKWLKTDSSEIPSTDYVEWRGKGNHSFTIFVIPVGTNSDVYYHKLANAFSHSIESMVDLSDYEHLSPCIKRICSQSDIPSYLEWSFWHDKLTIAINQRLILLVPLNEAVSLQRNGSTASGKGLTNQRIIQVPTKTGSFGYDADGWRVWIEPKDEAMKISQHVDKDVVMYSNLLAMICFDIPRGLVVY